MNKWLIFYLLSFIAMSSPSYAQSDIDSEQQLIYTYFYSKQPEEAKKIIDTAFLTSSKDSKKIIGYVYLADYYSFSDNDEKRIDALEKAKKIALKTKNDRDMAYVNFGLAQYYLKLDMNELFIDAVN
ncbi:TPA: tetratricopeptide repeat protein, partial [Elizabethkingia anophelis]